MPLYWGFYIENIGKKQGICVKISTLCYNKQKFRVYFEVVNPLYVLDLSFYFSKSENHIITF